MATKKATIHTRALTSIFKKFSNWFLVIELGYTGKRIQKLWQIVLFEDWILPKIDTKTLKLSIESIKIIKLGLLTSIKPHIYHSKPRRYLWNSRKIYTPTVKKHSWWLRFLLTSKTPIYPASRVYIGGIFVDLLEQTPKAFRMNLNGICFKTSIVLFENLFIANRDQKGEPTNRKFEEPQDRGLIFCFWNSTKSLQKTFGNLESVSGNK